MSEKVHVGIKYLHLVIVALLAIAALLYQFWNWIAGMTNIFNLGIIWTMLLIYELIVFLIQLSWKFFSAYIKKIIPNYSPLGLKTVVMWAVVTVGLVWTLFNFFTVLPLAQIPMTTIQTYGFGLTILWIGAVFIFFLQTLWAVAHRLSE